MPWEAMTMEEPDRSPSLNSTECVFLPLEDALHPFSVESNQSKGDWHPAPHPHSYFSIS